ncbi:acyltransferase [Mycolicibacterium sp. 050232]|uniref:acyltransferase family protein n=1 Tax=Mycolicibacterium sp. 050232 TaxID=3113982 RepID=UPI002E2CF4F6|nr:acyltransferase [Mycolicibacterium sp. 050232]MED5814336.1 acyltransferase [Mycolicibacterium sp. 050232]
MTERDRTFDVARGIAIIAIVVGHVWRGFGTAGLIDAPESVLIAVDRGLYLFHLSVFVFISGLFTAGSADRAGWPPYVWQRFVQFTYLYLLWSILEGCVKALAGSSVNTAQPWSDVLQVWRPASQMWFLPFLLAVIVAFVPWRPWSSKLSSRFAVGIAVVISVILWGVNGQYVFTQGLGLTAFFVIGLIWGAARVQAALKRISVTAAVLIAIAAWLLFALSMVWVLPTAPSLGGEDRTPLTVGVGIVASTAGLVGVLAVSYVVVRVPSWATDALALLGRRSMELYLAHIVFIGTTRIVLIKLGLTNVPLVFALTLIAGVIGPLILSSILKRIGAPWLFEAPRAISRAPAWVSRSN